MYYDVAEVHQHPARVDLALTAPGILPFAAQVFVQRIEQRLHVARVLAGGQNKIIGEGYHPFHVQQNNVLRLFIGKKLDYSTG